MSCEMYLKSETNRVIMTLLTGGFLPVCFVRSRSQTLVGEISALFFCCGVHDSIKKHGIKECAVEYRKMFYGPVMNKVTENRENQGTESNLLHSKVALHHRHKWWRAFHRA